MAEGLLPDKDAQRTAKNYATLLGITLNIIIIADRTGVVQSLNEVGQKTFGQPYDESGNKLCFPGLWRSFNNVSKDGGVQFSQRIRIQDKYYNSMAASFLGYTKQELYIVALQETVNNGTSPSKEDRRQAEYHGLIGSSYVFRSIVDRS